MRNYTFRDVLFDIYKKEHSMRKSTESETDTNLMFRGSHLVYGPIDFHRNDKIGIVHRLLKAKT